MQVIYSGSTFVACIHDSLLWTLHSSSSWPHEKLSGAELFWLLQLDFLPRVCCSGKYILKLVW